MTQEALASKLRLTRQQLQQYEHGRVRVGAATLYGFATVLGVPVAWFFEGLSSANSPQEQSQPPVLQEDPPADDVFCANAESPIEKGTAELVVEEVLHAGADARTKKGILDLIRAFEQVKSPEGRQTILDEAKRLAEQHK